jgi:hypothetical protein
VRVRSCRRLLLVLGLLWVPVVCAEPPVNVQVEVDFLLAYVEGSGCEFYRNGTWHNPKAAQAHLRDKYKYLAARNLINTTEDFIEKVATQSSLTGQPYKVRCRDGATVMTNQWLHAELARFREFNKRPTSGLLEPRLSLASTTTRGPVTCALLQISLRESLTDRLQFTQASCVHLGVMHLEPSERIENNLRND